MSDRGAANNSDVRLFWNDQASEYERSFRGRSGDSHALRVRLNSTLQFLGDGPGIVLDAGMGPGRLCAELAARGWTVFGVDASREMVVRARARLTNGQHRLFESSIESLPFADATFDRVAATGVLEYVVVPNALAELSRVLKPAGIGVISYPNPRAFYRIWKSWLYYPAVRALRRLTGSRGRPPRAAKAIRANVFEEMLQRAGFEPIGRELTSVLVLPAPLDTVFPGIAERLGRTLEGIPLAKALLATQMVYAVRRIAHR